MGLTMSEKRAVIKAWSGRYRKAGKKAKAAPIISASSRFLDYRGANSDKSAQHFSMASRRKLRNKSNFH